MCLSKPKAPKVESAEEARKKRDAEIASLQQQEAIRSKRSSGYSTSGLGSTTTLGSLEEAKF